MGQMLILQSSFVNSPRHLHVFTQDAYIYIRNYGRPDLFMTITCNPAWLEITRELIPSHNSTDSDDLTNLTARVFRIKVQKIVALLTKVKILGGICKVLSVLDRVAKKRFASRALTAVVDGNVLTKLTKS